MGSCYMIWLFEVNMESKEDKPAIGVDVHALLGNKIYYTFRFLQYGVKINSMSALWWLEWFLGKHITGPI